MSTEVAATRTRRADGHVDVLNGFRRAIRRLIVAVVTWSAALVFPAVSQAAIRAAAGAPTKDPSGKVGDNVLNYANSIADMLIWVSIPGATLGIVIAGAMFMAGERRAQGVAMGVVVGLIVVVSAKGIAA
jgi:uncharacterized RDD family membrane protein YckC